MAPTSGNLIDFPFLTCILLLPLLGALLCLSTDRVRYIRVTATVTVLLELFLAAVLVIAFKSNPSSAAWTFQFADIHDWIPSLGVSYWIGVDGVAVLLVALTSLIMGIAVIAATYMIDARVQAFMALMLTLETALMGVFMAENLFLFFVFWEAMLIPMYFLMGVWGEERRVYATMKFVVYTIFGSFFMLVAIFFLWSASNPHTLDMAGTNGLVDQFTSHPLDTTTQTWLFLAFALAFAIKLPIFPFHTWAPTAYTESPIPVVIALSGILSKAGAFGFIRYCLPLFAAGIHNVSGLLSVLAIIGMLYAAVLALIQTDIKRIVAYASISHVNLIALGIFALNSTGLDGSVLQIVNHGVIITALFLAVAYIAARSGSRMLTDMGGLMARWPVLAWVFFLFVLAGLDLPGLGSFAGEFMILAGVFTVNALFSTVAALTVILAAWYMIRFFQDTMNGPLVASPQQVAVTVPTTSDPDEALLTPYQYPVMRRIVSDLRPREWLLLVPLAALVIYIGIKPDTLTRQMNGTTAQITQIVHSTGGAGALGGGR